MIPQKKEEVFLFSNKSVDELFELYKPMAESLLNLLESRSTLSYAVILSDLEIELKKAIRLYKKNKRYTGEQKFSSYYSFFFKEYVNHQIEKSLLKMKT